MPLYDYRCQACDTTTSVFTRSMSQVMEPVCRRCGGRDLSRMVSRVAFHVKGSASSEPASRFPSLDYYKDPRNIGRYVEESFDRFGVALPSEARERIDAAREGTMPKELDL